MRKLFQIIIFFYFASSESFLIKFPVLKKFQFQKYKKSFIRKYKALSENIQTFFILVPESSISKNKRKTLFPENIRNFVKVSLFFEFGLTPGSPIYNYCHRKIMQSNLASFARIVSLCTF